MDFFSQFNKSTAIWHTHRKVTPNSEIWFRIVHFNKTMAKTHLCHFFELVENDFLNSTSQQPNNTGQYLEILGRLVQINNSMAKKHLYMNFLSWWNKFFLNSTSQQQNDMPSDSEILGSVDQFNKSTNKKIPIFEINEFVK